ncbi:MAG: hypothetical protein OIF58_16120 [Cohaesibacter sp.]|nr:hypothetical protein [Cohaesibacter sp.]
MSKLDLSLRNQLVTRFLADLNDQDISYCVLSGLPKENAETDFDLDISVASKDSASIAQLIRVFAHCNDLLLMCDIWSGTHSRAYTLVKRASAARIVLKIDIMEGYASFEIGEILRHEEITHDRVFNGNFWSLSEKNELAYLAVRHIIKQDGRSYRVDRIRTLLGKNSLKTCAEIFPPIIVDAIEIAAAKTPQISERTMKRKLIKYGKARMGGKGRAVAWKREISRAIYRIRRPVGCTIAFLGPDGSGKSTLIQELSTRMEPIFHEISCFYWRPRFLPSPGRLKVWSPSIEKQENPDPHNVIPHGKIVSFIRLAYFCLDYSLGHFCVLLPLKIRKHLVIFDRFITDLRIDPLRYRMTVPAPLLSLVQYSAPKPDIIFALLGPPDILHARKPELSMEEMARQLTLLQQMADESHTFIPVDVDKDINEIIDEIIEIIMLSYSERGRDLTGDSVRSA